MQYDPTHEHSSTRTPPARRAARLSVPGRDRYRRRHRGPGALAGRSRTRVARGRGRHGGGTLRPHRHLRADFRRTLQSDHLSGRHGLGRRPLASRGRLRRRPNSGLRQRRRGRESHVRSRRGLHLDRSPRLVGARTVGGRRHRGVGPRHLLARAQRPREHVPAAVGAYIGAAYFFTSSASFANPAIVVGRMLSNSFAGIAPSSAPLFIGSEVVGGLAALALLRVLYPDVTPAEAEEVLLPHHQEVSA